MRRPFAHLVAMFGMFPFVGCVSSSHSNEKPHRPILIEMRPTDGGLYLSPRHRALLEKDATHSAQAALKLASYYEICVRDPVKGSRWRSKADALEDPALAVERLAKELRAGKKPEAKAMTVERYRQLTTDSRSGDSKAARELADFYWHADNDLNAALLWMRRAAELGDVEAESFVVRLELAVGMRQFVRPTE